MSARWLDTTGAVTQEQANAAKRDVLAALEHRYACLIRAARLERRCSPEERHYVVLAGTVAREIRARGGVVPERVS